MANKAKSVRERRREWRKPENVAARAQQLHGAVMMAAVGFFLVMAVLIINALVQYVTVQHCVNGSVEYFQQHNCINVLR